MKPAIRTAIVCAFVVGAIGQVSAHGASKGLHLHVEPEPAEPGGTVTVRVDAAERVIEVRLAFEGEKPKVERPRRPKRSLRFELTVPVDAAETASLQAEATTRDGGTLRASAVVRIPGPGANLFP